MTRHSHERALSESEFERLYDATHDLAGPFDVQCRFVLIAAGRLGMRAGEIAHFRTDWIDWDKRQIQVPSFDPCDKGRNDGPCGYCRKRAKSAAAHSDQLSSEEALDQRWNPKTSNSARAIPFDFDQRVDDVVEEFTFSYDRYPASRASINRRVDRLLEAAGWPTSKTAPHPLRATAATAHAYRGVPAPALQSLFGWADLGTAMKYLRLSGGATQQALHEAHAD